MAEYIDRNLIEWYGCNFEDTGCEKRECSGCSHAECSHSQVMQIPTADVIERSTMEILCNEYLSKCNCCDECCAETYCILNSLRTENRDCVNNLITYFTKRNIGE